MRAAVTSSWPACPRPSKPSGPSPAVRVQQFYMDSRNAVYDTMWRELAARGMLEKKDHYLYTFNDMTNTDGEEFIKNNASAWDAMQRRLLVPAAFTGTLTANDTHLALGFEMPVPSVIMLEITAANSTDAGQN